VCLEWTAEREAGCEAQNDRPGCTGLTSEQICENGLWVPECQWDALAESSEMQCLGWRCEMGPELGSTHPKGKGSNTHRRGLGLKKEGQEWSPEFVLS
jgi:hypothetical protein